MYHETLVPINMKTRCFEEGTSSVPKHPPPPGFFEFGQGHRGPMIPYCLGAP
ncbi:unnamed protein product, partial [Staurois parvus]